MSRVRPEPRPRPRIGVLRALLLAAGAVSFAWPAQAQLRGAVTVDDPTLLYQLQGDGQATNGAAEETSQPQPAYVPVSAGALPDDPATDGQNDAASDANLEAAPAAPVQPENTATDARTDDTTTGTVRATTIDSGNDLPLDEGAARIEAIEGLDLAVEDNPFQAPGIRVGSFILRPTIEQGITATSNADSSTTGSPAVMSETAFRLNATSDWTSNLATIDAYGTFRTTLSGDEVQEGAGGVNAMLQLDLGNDYQATGKLGYAIAPESAASPVSIANTTSEPLRQSITGSLGLEKDVGKARLAVTGGIDDESYGNADLEGGGTLSQKDRDSTLYTVALRAGYEVSPAVTPFIETEFGRNLYDLEYDSAGYARSSNQFGVRGGLALDLTEKLTGEVSVGWVVENFDDPRLETISSPSFGGDLAWSPMRGTMVVLSGATTLEGTTTPDQSGSVLYSGSLSVEREMRANLTGNVILGAGWRDYWGSDGHDLILDAEAGLTWWMNRYAGVTTRARHQTVSSNLLGRDSETNSIFLGLKLQR
jgi:hypothetical protein